uniref:N-acetyltransferase domain-containing protein n=1 Tax=Anser brachyrhynchus TaxID=132585 RepID=A0A8B9BAM8_9AVES
MWGDWLLGDRQGIGQQVYYYHYYYYFPLFYVLMFSIMGKAEDFVAREEWHGHVTSLSVACEFQQLLFFLTVSYLFFSERKGGFFIDLFVRISNQVAVHIYKQVGYSVYWTVLEYYSASSGEPDEDIHSKGLFCLKLNGKILMLSIPGNVSRTVFIG